jgi:hypothetical protein
MSNSGYGVGIFTRLLPGQAIGRVSASMSYTVLDPIE